MKIAFSSESSSLLFSLLTPAAHVSLKLQKQKQGEKEAPEWCSLILALAENPSVKLPLVNW